MGRGNKVLKKLTVIYIQKDLTFEYTVQVLNLFNLHSFSNVGLTHCVNKIINKSSNNNNKNEHKKTRLNQIITNEQNI